MTDIPIFVIDDDQKLNGLLQNYLSSFGFDVQAFEAPSLALEALKHESPHCIILDLMLPEMDGLQVCQHIRKTTQTPIIMLTARGDVSDRIVGLEMGADDYLPKPFEPRELVARIQSILRRAQPLSSEAEYLELGDLKLDFKQRKLWKNQHLISLTHQEFEALKLLAQHAGDVLNRDQILDALRGIEYDAFNRSVDITMSRIRQKLGDDPKNPKYIQTVWGSGYAFIAS